MIERKKISFVNFGPDVPIIRFILGENDSAYAVIDSGSETTLFDYKLIVGEHSSEFKINKTKNKINFIGVSGDSEMPIINTDTVLKLVDKESIILKIPVKDGMLIGLSHVSNHVSEQANTDISISAIIGSDLLTKLNAEIDYKNKELLVDYDISGQ